MMSNRHFLDLFWPQASHKRSTVFQLGPELLRHDLFPAPFMPCQRVSIHSSNKHEWASSNTKNTASTHWEFRIWQLCMYFSLNISSNLSLVTITIFILLMRNQGSEKTNLLQARSAAWCCQSSLDGNYTSQIPFPIWLWVIGDLEGESRAVATILCRLPRLHMVLDGCKGI